MVHKRKYSIISLILVVVLLSTGMYLDRVTEEFFILRECGKSSVLCHRLFQTDINDIAACTAVMFNECIQMEQQSIKLDLLLFLLYSGFIFLFAGKSYRYLETARFPWRVSDERVMDYMHQSDGKKRNGFCRLHIIE